MDALHVDQMFRAFADRTRLRIMHLLLRNGETCVGDLVEALDLQQPTVSRHLAYLRKADLVEVRRDGLWAFHSMTKPSSAFHKRLISCLGCCFEEVNELAVDLERMTKLKERGGCC